MSEIHEGKKPLLQKCNVCGKGFRHNADLIRHVTNVHKEKEPKKCPHCDSEFYQASLLNRHVAEVHEGKQLYLQCELCGKELKKSSLPEHISSVHEGKKSETIQCAICNKWITRKSLRKHLSIVHKGETPFKCEICAKPFDRETFMKKHISLIHGGKKSVVFDVNDGFKVIMSKRTRNKKKKLYTSPIAIILYQICIV